MNEEGIELIKRLQMDKPLNFEAIKGFEEIIDSIAKIREQIENFKINKSTMEMLMEHSTYRDTGIIKDDLVRDIRMNLIEKGMGVLLIHRPDKTENIKDFEKHMKTIFRNTLELKGFIAQVVKMLNNKI